ncbi:DUF2339 domain-containing protein [bacterium]|nr:DUF2339 domain-containing protein [bacterium]
MIFALTIIVILLIIYFFNVKSDLDTREAANRALLNKMEGQINDILRRLKALETSEMPIQQPQQTEYPEIINREYSEDVVEDYSNQTINLTQNTDNILPVQQIQQVNPNIQKAHSYNVGETKPSVSESEFDLEKLFLGNVFSKIGGIALVIAICFLVKLTSRYIEFTPVMKISMGYIASLGFLFYSLFLYKKETSVTAQILSGVSISGFLLSTYFACFFYNLFPIPFALFLAFMTALASYFISEKFNSFSTIAIGLFGGYLNPAVFNADLSLGILFGYLIALNFISVAYTFRNGTKNIINCINILFTVITLIIFSSRGTVSIVYPLLLWLLYVVYDIIVTMKEMKQSDSTLLRWFNFTALIYITNHIFHFTQKIEIGATIIAVGLIYGILYYLFKNKNEDVKNTNLQSGLICLLIGTFYLVNIPYLGLAWAVEGFLVSELYIKLQKPFLKNYVLVFFLSSFVYLFLNYMGMFPADNTGVLFFTFILYLAQAVIMLYSAQRLDKTDKYCKNTLTMLGYSILYLYAIFYFNIGNNDLWTKFFIDSIIAAIYSIHSYKLLSKDYKDFSLIFGEALYALSLILLFVAEACAVNNTDYIPFLNLEFFAFISVLALTIYYHKQISQIFGYIAVVIGLFALSPQINYMFTPLFPSDTMPLVITVSLMIYSGIILSVGILNNLGYMKQTSICLILVLLCKLIFVDLYNIDAIFKLIAFVIIGIILLGVSSYYQKLKINK